MRILQGLLLSLGVHFLMVWGSQFLPSPHVSNRDVIEIEVLPLSEAKNSTGQVVRQNLVPEDFKVPDNEDPRFLSERSQRVRQQMRAAETGKTQNRSPGLEQRGNAAHEQNKSRASARQRSEETDPDLFTVRKPRFPKGPKSEESNQLEQALRRGNNLPRYQDLPQGFSTVGESLPRELEVGHFTALNTDRYLFYSFFMRIEDLVRYEWESQVKQTILSTPRGVFQAQVSDNWVSVVEIQLRPNGEFHRAMLMKSSTIPGFDIAAMDSFAKAKLFPNPPAEMVEDDGLIHLKYSFTVRYQPRGMVESSGP